MVWIVLLINNNVSEAIRIFSLTGIVIAYTKDKANKISCYYNWVKP